MSARRKATVIAVAAVAASILACYFHVLGHLAYRWSHEEDYSHGFLVPVFSVWLFWSRRQMLATSNTSFQGRWIGLALIAASAGIAGGAELWVCPVGTGRPRRLPRGGDGNDRRLADAPLVLAGVTLPVFYDSLAGSHRQSDERAFATDRDRQQHLRLADARRSCRRQRKCDLAESGSNRRGRGVQRT